MGLTNKQKELSGDYMPRQPLLRTRTSCGAAFYRLRVSIVNCLHKFVRSKFKDEGETG
jgi:hypothetical protein